MGAAAAAVLLRRAIRRAQARRDVALVVVGYWRLGAVPRAVPVVWNQYTFYSIGYTKTLVV